MRKLLLGLGLVVVLIVGGLVAAYFAFFNEDSPPPLTLSSGTTLPASDGSTAPGTTAAPATPATLTADWTVAEGSVAGYRVREKLAQLPAKSDAVGRTNDVTGTVVIEGEGDALTVTAVDLTVDLTTLLSDSDRRDGQIQQRGLETAKFPTATFVLTQPIAIPPEALTGSPVTVEATGDMTIHGVTKTVTIPIDAQLNADQIELVGSYFFPMADFAIDPPSFAGIVDVDPDATLEFQLFLTR
jgi:polyisoprenoid-binding protein YceI